MNMALLDNLAPDVRRPLSCPHCHASIGTYTQRVLKIGQVEFTDPVKPRCAQCSHRIRWRPLPVKES